MTDLFDISTTTTTPV